MHQKSRKIGVRSYLNDNHTFLERTISKRIFNSSGLWFWGVFMYIFKGKCDKITVLQNIGG